MRKSKKRQSNKYLLLGVLLLTIAMGISEAILSPYKAQIENKGIITQVQSQNVTTGLVEPINNLPEDTLSNGNRVIRTKTPYFDNEVQVWLASEAACNSVGLGTSCINDLMSIAYTETRSFNYRAMGDGNKSYGAFQIHLGYHPEITVAQATDPYWAAKWTIKRLLAKGYLKDRDYAVMSHNGTPYTKATLGYLATVNKYLSM